MDADGFILDPARGAAHITAAKGIETLAYIEIEEGPYLVRPVEQSFESDEKPVNLDASNIVWLNAFEIIWQRPDRRFDSRR